MAGTGSVWVAASRTVHAAGARARRDGPLFALCLGLIAFGVWLRCVDLGFPNALTWDEHHFVLNARNYLQHKHDWNDHPPLGKLLIALGMLVVGDTSVGWRLSSLTFGLLSILLARCLAVTVYRDRRAGWLAAAFVAGDGFLVSYSRTALLDGVLTALILLSAWLGARARSPRGIAAAAIAMGFASSVKASGVALALPLGVACLGQKRKITSLALLALAPLVYTLFFSLGLALTREPHSAGDAWRTTVRLIAQHAAEHTFSHPMTSHWYTWFLPKRPITIRYDADGPFAVRVSTTLGNLLLWWSAGLALLGGAGVTLVALVKKARAPFDRVRLRRVTRATATVFTLAIAMLLPWMVSSRDSYMYHYLPPYTALLILVGGTVSRVYRRHRWIALSYVASVVLVSAYYAPVWAQLPLTRAAFEQRLFLPMWR